MCFGILTMYRRQNAFPLPNLPFFLLSLFLPPTALGVPSMLRVSI